MNGSVRRPPGGVLAAAALATPLVAYQFVFLAVEAAPIDYVYGWIAPGLLAVALVVTRSHGRDVGFARGEYDVVGTWAAGTGAFVGLSVFLTLFFQVAKGATLADPDFVASNWTLTGIAIGTVIGVYDADRRVRAADVEAANERNAQLVQQLSVLNRVLRHDVRTAVNVITGYADLVNPDDDRERLALDRVNTHAESLLRVADNARLLQDLLENTEQQPVDVASHLEERTRALAREHPELDLDVDLEDDAVVVAPRLLPAALDVALDAVVENNTPIDLALAVACERTTHDDDPCVEVTIADNGIALSEVERVVYESAEETQLVHGSGVDLWLVKWAVEAANGAFLFDTADGWNRMTIHLPAD